MKKYASMAIIEAHMGAPSGLPRYLDKIAHRAVFDYTPRQGYLYVRSRAISSRCNDNWDEFPADEIKKSWHTFIGKPVFVNHHNANISEARGVIIDAALHEDVNPDGTPDTWVEVLQEVDAKNFPKLAAEILAGNVDRTSMGCDVAFSVCSACGNKAASPLEYCEHIPAMKGMPYRRYNAAANKVEAERIREVCYGLGFFENSILVEDPADPTAHFLAVDASGVGGGYQGNLKAASKTASDQGSMFDRHNVPATYTKDSLLARIEDLKHYGANGSDYVRGVNDSLQDALRYIGHDDLEQANYWIEQAERYVDHRIEQNRRNIETWVPGQNHQNQPWLDVPPRPMGGPRAKSASKTADLSPADYERAVLTTKETGGVTMSTHGETVPKQGYMVSIEGHEEKHPLPEFGPEDVKEYVETHRDSLAPIHRFLGAWLDTGIVYLDSSEWELAFARAMALAQQWHQLAIFDLATMDVIRTDMAMVGGNKHRHYFFIEIDPDNFDHHAIHGLITGQQPMSKLTSKTAGINDKLKAPPEIDTLRDETCPVCGETDSFNGDQCGVCQYVKPPEPFMDPNLDLAKQVNLRQDQEQNQGAINSTDVTNLAATQLQCDSCGAVHEGQPAVAEVVTDPDGSQIPGQDAPLGSPQDPALIAEGPPPPVVNGVPQLDPAAVDPNAPPDNAPFDPTPPDENAPPEQPGPDDPNADPNAPPPDAPFDPTKPDENAPPEKVGPDTAPAKRAEPGDEIPADQGKVPVDVKDSITPPTNKPDGNSPDDKNPAKADPKPDDPTAQPKGTGDDSTGKPKHGDPCPTCGAGTLHEKGKDGGDDQAPGKGDDDKEGSDGPPWMKGKDDGGHGDKSDDGKSKDDSKDDHDPKDPVEDSDSPTKDQKHQKRSITMRSGLQALANAYRRLDIQAIQLSTQDEKINRIAHLAGVEPEMQAISARGQQRIAALPKLADENNPAQPIPQPGSEAPYTTTAEEIAPISPMSPEGGSLGNEVTTPGSTTETNVAPDAQTDLLTPVASLSPAARLALQRIASRACPYCGSNQTSSYGTSEGHENGVCNSCGQEYSAPVPGNSKKSNFNFARIRTEAGAILDVPLDLNEQDVTKPVEGTTEPRPTNEVRIETEIVQQDGDESNDINSAQGIPGPNATPPTKVSAVQPPSIEERFYASQRLARLRLATGTAQGDPIALGEAISREASISDEAMTAEISALEAVVRAQGSVAPTQQPVQQGQVVASRSLVPRTAQSAMAPGASKSMPSFAAAEAQGYVTVPMQSMAAAVTDDEILFE